MVSKNRKSGTVPEKSRDWLFYTVIAIVFLIVGITDAPAAENKVYVGVQWVHLSNLDAGPPFNDDYEDHVDHAGVVVEFIRDYNYSIAFASVGIGVTRSARGWDCSGCSLPSSIQMGIKWRIK